jgi:hypothetical protein
VGRIWRYELEPVEGGTKVTETWDISKESLRFVLRYIAVRDTRKAMEKSLEELGELVTSPWSDHPNARTWTEAVWLKPRVLTPRRRSRTSALTARPIRFDCSSARYRPGTPAAGRGFIGGYLVGVSRYDIGVSVSGDL